MQSNLSRLACFALLGLFLAGCGEIPAPAAKKSSKKTKPAAPALPVVQPIQVAADAYPSVDAAMAEVETLTKSSGADTSQRLMKIEKWLEMQGDKIAPDLAGRIKNPSAGLATRITACRVITKTKSDLAIPTLLEATSGEPRQLRLKAIESVGRIKPSKREVLDRMMQLVDDEDFDTRKTALIALANMGPPAKDAVPKLTLMLNNVKEDETIRSLAKAALKSIDPRRGLMNHQ